MIENLNALQTGSTLNHYIIEAVLGSGGFGIVYKAHHTHLDEQVVIKEFLPVELAGRHGNTVQPHGTSKQELYSECLRRFMVEGKTLIKLRHPNVVRCRDLFTANGTAYLVMDFEDGLPLDELVRSLEAQGSRYTEQQLLHFLLPLADGLSYIHQQGVLHRDIKPANVFIRRSDGSPVIIDFGAAKQNFALASQSQAPFTEFYAPLEQIEGGGEAKPTVDIHAFGGLMYRLATGQMGPKAEARAMALVYGNPDPLKPATELAKGHYSTNFLTTIDQCLAFKASERPQSMQQVKQRLMPNSLIQPAAAQPQYQLHSEPQPQSQPVSQAATRQLWPVKWLATSAVLLLLAVGSWQVLQYRAEQTHLAQQDQQAWQLATADHTEQSYQLYLSTQPQGQYRLDAQTQLEALQAEAAQLQLLVQQQQAEAAAREQAQAKQVERVLGKLVAIPAGSFIMGCDQSTPERQCYDTEKPSRQVKIGTFKLMETEVTFAMWDACVSEGGCNKKPADEGWGRGSRPVINVSFNDITQQFIPWVNNITGLRFRLPSEAEWEFAARAGLSVKDSNAKVNCESAHIGQPYSCKGDLFKTLPVRSYHANAFGLFDMAGNVGELVADCHRDNYNNAPTDGSVKEYKNCQTRVWRGGSFGAPLSNSHVSIRGWHEPYRSSYGIGFRLALSE